MRKLRTKLLVTSLVLTMLATLNGLTSVGAVPPEGLQINVLSNRADLVSGGDALVEVVLPDGVAPSSVRVTVDGRDVTSAFAVRADGRFYGLVTGLVVGANTVLAEILPAAQAQVPPGKTSAQIVITNHPVGGPVFSGAQLHPWICAHTVATVVPVTIPGPPSPLFANVTSRVSGLDFDPVDDQCNATAKFTYFYQPKATQGTSCTFTIPPVTLANPNPCFVPYDPTNPPADADIADFTNDRGDTAKSIILLERGTVNRGIYQLVTFFDPTKTSAPWLPQKGWNDKLLWRFGASASVSRFQSPPATSVFLDRALRRGFMIASSSLTDHGTNSNDTLGAETMMMVKEHIAETYGPIRYTIGDGCSGGSIMQHSISGAYPGLLQGIQPNCSFPDTQTTFIEIADCGVLQNRYYATADGSTLTPAQRAAINGHTNTGFCNAWIVSFLNAGNPSVAGNCGSGWPSALTYSTTASPPRPNGVRCDGADHDVAMLGTFVDTDGNTKANQLIDNVGVEYGLTALAAGIITPEEFVRLNEGVGGYTADLTWTGPSPAPGTPAPRQVAQPGPLHTAYSGGLVSDGAQLAKVAIIDLRGNQNPAGDIHMNWRAWALRDRLDRANGEHDNQLIWAYTGGGGAGPVGAALAEKAFATMDQWLANIEQDTSDHSIQDKVRLDKPADATDICLTDNGATAVNDVGLTSPACPVKFQSSPRQAAGGPLAENVFKCQLKPLDFFDADFGGVLFDDGQKARLNAVFPSGVCDWTKPGVGQVPEDGWTTFANGPGGAPLGDPPVSVNGCAGKSDGRGNAPNGGCPGNSGGR
jgi:uncharacterized tannase-like protein DUF6351